LEAQSASVNVGHSDLGGKTRVTLLWTGGILDLADRLKKKKEVPELSRELEELDARWTGRRLGLRWTPVNARDRAGPATLSSHGGGATRRLGVTGLIT
jgi:hypothetical protein